MDVMRPFIAVVEQRWLLTVNDRFYHYNSAPASRPYFKENDTTGIALVLEYRTVYLLNLSYGAIRQGPGSLFSFLVQIVYISMLSWQIWTSYLTRTYEEGAKLPTPSNFLIVDPVQAPPQPASIWWIWWEYSKDERERWEGPTFCKVCWDHCTPTSTFSVALDVARSLHLMLYQLLRLEVLTKYPGSLIVC